MRQVIGGDGSDKTSLVQAWLASGAPLTLANLYLIGELEDPLAIWLTDWESPLLWSAWGTFRPAVVKRGTVESKIGLEVSNLDVTWSPRVAPFTQNTSTANPYQLAQMGYYDNWKVRIWTVYMPTPGDANTYGASELFGGRVADTTIERGVVHFQVNSFLDVVNQDVPSNLIELTNTLAAYTAATPPKGFSNIPQFDVIAGDSPTEVIGDMTSPDPHSILDTNVCQHGYLVFNRTANATLGGVWAAIQQNIRVTLPDREYNQFVLYTPLPWTPTPGLDTFYVSGSAPIDKSDGDYFGFPYVPDPSIAL